jgi:hypothetical protein
MLEITQFFTMGNPLRVLRLHSFRGRLHRLNVGDYTVFHYGKRLEGFEITQFWWRLHNINVGDHTVFTMEIP